MSKKYKIICVIIVNNKGEILLSKRGRSPFLGYWALISGIGESKKGIPPAIGVVEEVRCDLGTNSFRGKYLFSMPIENDKQTDKIVVFEGRIKENEIRINPEFSLGYKWVPADHLEEFKTLAFEHSRVIDEYLRKRRKAL